MHTQFFTPIKIDFRWSKYLCIKFSNGFLPGQSENEDEEDENENDEAKEMARDKRRWDLADKDKDNLLSKDEFFNFLNPEEVPEMRPAVVQESMDDMDKVIVSIPIYNPNKTIIF